MLPDTHVLLTFEHLHSIHLGISERLMRIVLPYVSSHILLTNLGHTLNKQKPSIVMKGRKTVFCMHNAYLIAVEMNGRGNGLIVDFEDVMCRLSWAGCSLGLVERNVGGKRLSHDRHCLAFHDMFLSILPMQFLNKCQWLGLTFVLRPGFFFGENQEL